MPIDDNNNLINRGSNRLDAAAALDELTPPQYGEHQFDQLYSEIDLSGYMTPVGGPSGMSTPFQSRSRSVSSENLTSLNGVATSDLAANVLQSRLTSLDVAGSTRVLRDRMIDRSQLSSSGDGQGGQGDEPGTMPSAPLPLENNDESQVTGNTISRQTSEEDDNTSSPVTPQHIEYSAESLAKVPSYTTALQSQTRTPVNDGLPTYQNAIRAPRQMLTPSTPRLLTQIHVHPPENHRDMLRRCS